MEKHADLPWHIEEMHGPDNELCFEAFKDAHEGFVASTFAGSRPADAAFIVKACNNHYQLIEAIEDMLAAETGYDEYSEACEKARQAIKQAESNND